MNINKHIFHSLSGNTEGKNTIKTVLDIINPSSIENEELESKKENTEIKELVLLRELVELQDKLDQLRCNDTCNEKYMENLNDLCSEMNCNIGIYSTRKITDDIIAFLEGRAICSSEKLYNISKLINNLADLVLEEEKRTEKINSTENQIVIIKQELGIR